MSNDLPQMPEECIWAFNEVSKIGRAQGYTDPNGWKKEHPFSHLLKGIGHAMDFLLNRDIKDNEKHLLHAMWRVCAATALVIIEARDMHVDETGMVLTPIAHYGYLESPPANDE